MGLCSPTAVPSCCKTSALKWPQVLRLALSWGGVRDRSNSKGSNMPLLGSTASRMHGTHIHPHVPQVPAQPHSAMPQARMQGRGFQEPRGHSRLQWRLRPNRDPSCYKRGNTFLFRVRCVHISMTKFVQSSQFKNEVSQQLVIPHIYSKIKVSTNPCRVVQK